MPHLRLALTLLLLAVAPARAEMALMLFDQPGCEWCARWEREIGGAYPLTEEGAQAPLRRASIHEPLPEGVRLVRPARFTPTFVLLRDGQEVGRLEGYAGEDFFYPMLTRLLAQAAARAD
ncbi:MAG: thioredoxin family protein [Pseudomonadota bacterium]